MQLEDFVAESLRQLIEGVRKAQGGGAGVEGSVNPEYTTCLDGGLNKAVTQQVEFDVAVTAVEGTAPKGGFGIVVGGITLGASGQSNASSTSVSRIKVTVPVNLPRGPSEKPSGMRRTSASNVA